MRTCVNAWRTAKTLAWTGRSRPVLAWNWSGTLSDPFSTRRTFARRKAVTMPVKAVFVVQALGYWGRGQTLSEAGFQCRKAGAKVGAAVACDLFTHPTDNPVPEVVDMLTVRHLEGAERIRLG